MTDAELIEAILTREGEAFTDDALDRGGATKWGITSRTLTAWRGRPTTVAEIKGLSRDQAAEIYRERYLRPVATIPHEALRAAVADFSVTSGLVAAVRALQLSVGVPDDGILGAKTLRAVTAADPRLTLTAFTAHRVAYYCSIVDGSPGQGKWFHGWVKRAIACMG